MKQKLIIDTDPGIDDAMAIHYAFAHQGLDVLGLTCVFGNVFAQQASRNALILSEQAGYPLDVVEGAERPLIQPLNPPSHHVHGREGFGDKPALIPQGKPLNKTSDEYLSQMCREHSGEVILCPVGPLTNIASVLRHDPDIVHHVRKLVIMGGAVWVPGNVSVRAEANIWNDPHAADAVFAADWDIDLIGLDVTQTIACEDDDFRSLRQASPEIGGFLHDISEFYIRFYHSVMGREVCLMHDPSALVAITDDDLFTYKQTPLSVVCAGEETGRTVPDDSLNRRPVRVAVSADSEKIRTRFLDICGQADKMKQLRQSGADLS